VRRHHADPGVAVTQQGPGALRSCGGCTLCCTVLRVDELSKLGGEPCAHQREGVGCAIHATRPGICRAYRCLWLAGALREQDRPDRLGALLDLVSRAGVPELRIREARPGAVERCERLSEIAEHYRASMPVRIGDVADVLDPDRPYRVLLPGGEEHVVRGERVVIRREGRRVGERRLPWLERLARRAGLWWQGRRIERLRRRGARP
jgi:hypothetical protein